MDTNTNPAAQSAIIRYSYEGTPIAFSNGKDMMVNATQMAKPFGKRPVDFLNTQQTKDFMQELVKVRKITLTDLVHVKKGGHNAGTWMHQDVALEFARWLSPKFAIWTNDRIRELLLQGYTSLYDNPRALRNTIDTLLLQIQEKDTQIAVLRAKNNIVLNALRKITLQCFDCTDSLVPFNEKGGAQ